MVQDTDTSGLTFLPAADEDLSAADELANVFTDPEDALDVDLETQLPPRIPFGRTWQFDFGSRRLVRWSVGDSSQPLAPVSPSPSSSTRRRS